MKQITVVAQCLLVSAVTAFAQQAAPAAPVPPAPTPGAISVQRAPYNQDTVSITLAPKEGMEYKYGLLKGQALLYSWTSTAPVHYELHSEPAAGPKGYAEFFDQHDARDASHGSYVAPFDGIHGWYWENRSNADVVLKLSTSGFYSESLEFRKAQPIRRKTF